MFTIAKGTVVMWRGNHGRDPMRKAVVCGITYGKYGDDVEGKVQFSERGKYVFHLDVPGKKDRVWCYGWQIVTTLEHL